MPMSPMDHGGAPGPLRDFDDILIAAERLARTVLGPAETDLDKLVDDEEIHSHPTFVEATKTVDSVGWDRLSLPESLDGVGLPPHLMARPNLRPRPRR